MEEFFRTPEFAEMFLNFQADISKDFIPASLELSPGFFGAVFQWVRVTSGALRFWANFVEFFGKNCKSFDFFWKSC